MLTVVLQRDSGCSGCFSVCNYKELLMSYQKLITKSALCLKTVRTEREHTHKNTHKHVFTFTETKKQTSLQFFLLTLLVVVTKLMFWCVESARSQLESWLKVFAASFVLASQKCGNFNATFLPFFVTNLNMD